LLLLGGVAFDTSRTPHAVPRTLVIFAVLLGTLRAARVIIVFSKVLMANARDLGVDRAEGLDPPRNRHATG
jgi:uncharacterized membrane protein